MKKYTVWFDMDGTLGNLYAVDDWLPKIRHEDASPYLDAAPMLRLCTLARLLNALQRNGYEIGVISWLSKGGSEKYGEEVAAAISLFDFPFFINSLSFYGREIFVPLFAVPCMTIFSVSLMHLHAIIKNCLFNQCIRYCCVFLCIVCSLGNKTINRLGGGWVCFSTSWHFVMLGAKVRILF